MKCKQLYKYSLLLKGDEKMLASEILAVMKRKTRNSRIIIAVLAIVLILENLFFLFH